MKFFIDGNHLAITKDNFIDLQTSPAIFYPLESEIAKTVLKAGTIIALPVGDLIRICNLLRTLQVEYTWPKKGNHNANEKTNTKALCPIHRGR